MIPALPGPWLLIAAFALVAAAARRAPRPSSRTLWLLGAIVAFGAVARLGCGLWGPSHVNGQGPLWVRGAIDYRAIGAYGPGYFELLNWVSRLGWPADYPIFAANALLSALAPALLYALLRLTALERGIALAAALVLAVDSVTLRTAASEGYTAPLVVLVLAVHVALALGVERLGQADRMATLFSWAAAGLIAGAAARIHPVSYFPLAVCPLAVLLSPHFSDWPARLRGAAAAAAVIAGGVLATSATTVLTVLRTQQMVGSSIDGLASQNPTPLLLLVAGALVARRWLGLPWLPLLVICLPWLLLLVTQEGLRQHPLQKLGYQRLFFPILLLAGAALLRPHLQSPRRALPAAALLALVLLFPAVPSIGEQTTEQLEYRFLREVLRRAPEDCSLAAVSRAGNRVWEIPTYLIPTSRPHHPSEPIRLRGAAELHDAGANCLWYVRSSLCTSVEGRATCDAIERDAQLAPIARQVFPALPSYARLPYDRPEVEVIVFRVVFGPAARPDPA